MGNLDLSNKKMDLEMKMSEERHNIDLISVKQECLRRSIETAVNAYEKICRIGSEEQKKNSDLLEKLSELMKVSADLLKTAVQKQ
jgi:hypothetical protein